MPDEIQQTPEFHEFRGLFSDENVMRRQGGRWYRRIREGDPDIGKKAVPAVLPRARLPASPLHPCFEIHGSGSTFCCGGTRHRLPGIQAVNAWYTDSNSTGRGGFPC